MARTHQAWRSVLALTLAVLGTLARGPLAPAPAQAQESRETAGAPGIRVLHETIVYPAFPKNLPNYRIPAIILAANGDILAFAERRITGIGDVGDNEMVVRRSTDGGKTWSNDIEVFAEGLYAHSDPVPLVDSTGRIWFFFTFDRKKIAVTWSDDHGATWQKPKFIHDQIVPKEWDSFQGSTNTEPVNSKDRQDKVTNWKKGWEQRYGVGCGAAAVEIREGKHAGRIVVPARAMFATPQAPRVHHTYAFYSDDRGQTWRRGQLGIPYGNENQLVELKGGVLLVNSRDSDHRNRPDRMKRRFATSQDGGETWKDVRETSDIPNPEVHNPIKRYTHGGVDVLLTTTPASRVRQEKHPYGRRNMSLLISRDNGLTWSQPQTIYDDVSSYSEILPMPDGTVCVIYERGPAGSVRYWDELAFVRLQLDLGKF